CVRSGVTPTDYW
nr:immunoglobulin heavy chain junction region [Macaca mulatta]